MNDEYNRIIGLLDGDKFATYHIMMLINAIDYRYSWLIHTDISNRYRELLLSISPDIDILRIDNDKNGKYLNHCYWLNSLYRLRFDGYSTIVYNRRYMKNINEYILYPNRERLCKILGYSPYYPRYNRIVLAIYIDNKLLHYMITDDNNKIISLINLCKKFVQLSENINYSIGYEPTYGLVKNKKWMIKEKCRDIMPITEDSEEYARLIKLLN